MDTMTPHTALAVFVASDGYERTLDFLESPYGLDHEDVEKTAIEITIDTPPDEPLRLWVMHPERALRSRVHNHGLPSKQTSLAQGQLRAAIRFVPAFGRLLLDEGVDARTVMK